MNMDFVRINGKEYDLVQTNQAYVYGIWKELEAIRGESIRESDVLEFLDTKCNEIGEALSENYNEWLEEKSEENGM